MPLTPGTPVNSSQPIASPAAVLAGADQDQAPDTGTPQSEVPQDSADALAGAPIQPPFAQRVASGANALAASNPAPQKPGAWSRAILGGVVDALSGFISHGGAGEQAAQNEQGIEKQKNLEKQQAVENQQNQQKLISENKRNDILNAYTTAQTIADQKTAARLDQDAMDQHVAAGKVAAAAFKNHPKIADNVLEDDALPEFKAGGKFDPHKTIGFQTGETQVEKGGKIVTEPTYTVFARQAGQVDIDAPTSALLKQHGQGLPEGTHIDSDILNNLVTEAIASQTTTNLVNKALDDQTNLDLLKDQASVQNLKDRAAVNPYLGVHPGDPIEALSDLSQQKDPKTKQLTQQAQAASRILSQWDPKELETYRHDKADEAEKQREYAQKRLTGPNAVWGDPDAPTAEQFRASLSQAQRDVVDLIGQGRAPINRPDYILARNPGVIEAVAKLYPNVDLSKIGAYQDATKKFEAGKTGDTINAGATALEHLEELKALNTTASMIPGTPAYTAYQNKVGTVTSELMSFYQMSKTQASEDAIKSGLGARTSWNRNAAIQTQAQSMGDKLENFKDQWDAAAPSPQYEAQYPGISDTLKARRARAAIDPAFAAAHPELRQSSTSAIPVPPGKASVFDPQGVQHFVDADKLTNFLADPTYKGWHQ